MKKRFTLVCQVLHATHLVSLYLFPFLLPLLLFFSQCFPVVRVAPPWLLILIVKYRPRLWLPKCVLDSSSDEDSAGN